MEYPSVPHRPPQFNTSVPHKDHIQHPKSLSSTQETPQFKQKPLSSTSPSVPHRKPLIKQQNALTSTAKTTQFHPPPQFHNENPSVPHTPQFHTENCVELRGFECGTDGCVELRGYWCGTEGFLVWN